MPRNDSLLLAEVWKPVVGYEGYYEVSSLGAVRSVTRTLQIANHERTYVGRLLKQSVMNSGYNCIVLSVDGKLKTHLVHRLVAKAFLPESPGMSEVNHIDGNKLHNSAANLEWVDSSYNKWHAWDTGLRQRKEVA